MKRLWRWSTLFLIILLTLGFFLFHRIWYLSAEPGKDKLCRPVFPEYQERDNTLELSEAPTSTLEWAQVGGTINDASCVDETAVYGVVQIQTEEDLQNALQFAKDRNLKISLAGAKHSMGGHAFSPGNLVLDMTTFNDIAVDADSQTVTVQSGATWHDIQNIIHPDFAIMAMQSTDIFTVGGSISVNAHGMDHQAGAVENSIQSLRVLLPTGEILTASRDQNIDLYERVVGGYGLFGIILDVTLQIVPNDIYESSRKLVDYNALPAYLEESVFQDEQVGLMYSHLSTAPGKTFLRESLVYVYTKSTTTVTRDEIPPLGEVSGVKMRRLLMNASKLGPNWQRLRWWMEKKVEPLMESCSISRNDAQRSGEACLVARNEPMHDSVPYLRNSLKSETDILHEYFIPRNEFVSFVDGMREIMEEEQVNLLNASVRVVNAERGVLTYAPEPAYSIVLYINQKTTDEGHVKMRRVTQQLIDLTTAHNGRFFLPYQLHYTDEQLRESYPNIDDVFASKVEYDPQGILSNTWYERYRRD